MNTLPPTLSQKKFSQTIMGRLLIVWLPIISVGAVIFWLAGGLPPTSWLLFLQMVSRWNSLQATHGIDFIIAFAIVLVQCLCILAAWVILVITAWREIAVFNKLREHQRLMASQAKQAAKTNPPSLSRQQGVQAMPEKTSQSTGIKVGDDDAFDMNKAVFELSSEADPSESSAQQQPVKKPEMGETVFLYGNPLEGDLPEVFDYDMDLKRGVQSLQEELRQQQEDSQFGNAQHQGKQNTPTTTEK